jgi:putative redox protein
MAGLGMRSVTLRRTGKGQYEAVNPRGGRLAFGSGDDDQFTPVELLLTAIAGCSAVDVDLITGKRAEPLEFEVTAAGEKIRDDATGNRMRDVELTFRVRFPEGEQGDAARTMLPRAVAQSHDRLCTVSRTVELGAPVRASVAD